jgi:hypothetical protein
VRRRRPLGNHVHHAALTLEQALSTPELVRSVPGLQFGERRFRRGSQVVETRQLVALGDLLSGVLGMRTLGALEAPFERAELTTRQMQPERSQLGD